ncbi:MAG: hypothetical protein HOO67_03435 [Candidatus Peribacteraceae bacterium]|nr:hypothetical protein [Candidatus Peribacteraceae bacterium]
MLFNHRTLASSIALGASALLLTPLVLAAEQKVEFHDTYHSPAQQTMSSSSFSSSSSSSSFSSSSSSSVSSSSSWMSSPSSSATLPVWDGSMMQEQIDSCMRQTLLRSSTVALERMPRIFVDRAKLRACIIDAVWMIYHKGQAASMSPASSSSPRTVSAGVSPSVSVSFPSGRPGIPLTRNISLRGNTYEPRFTQVKRGATVTWTNNDTVAHTITGDMGLGPLSGNLKPGESYSFTFMNTGTYPYHSDTHLSMRGTLQVIK